MYYTNLYVYVWFVTFFFFSRKSTKQKTGQTVVWFGFSSVIIQFFLPLAFAECDSDTILSRECTRHNLRDKGQHEDADSEQRGTSGI